MGIFFSCRRRRNVRRFSFVSGVLNEISCFMMVLGEIGSLVVGI